MRRVPLNAAKNGSAEASETTHYDNIGNATIDDDYDEGGEQRGYLDNHIILETQSENNAIANEQSLRAASRAENEDPTTTFFHVEVDQQLDSCREHVTDNKDLVMHIKSQAMARNTSTMTHMPNLQRESATKN